MKLEIKNITKKYGSFAALDNFSVTLENGVYALLGPNGAGKSTLSNIICQTVKATSGEILLDGKNINSMGRDYRSLLGYAPQVTAYYRDFTALYFLEYMGRLKEIGNKSEIRQKAEHMLELVNLSDVKHKKIKEFSGGMKQRIGIAQALLNDPKILILDEPTAGLDPKERIRLRNIISKLSFDRIVIIATHIVSDVEYIANEVLLIKSGRLIKSGSPDSITGELGGKVYNVTVDKQMADHFVANYRTSNLTANNDGHTASLRLISDTPPAVQNAVLAQPNLEDAYLYYFGSVDENSEVGDN